jgi:hypothetical protein
LLQICNLIPANLVPKLARETKVDKKARTFSPWSHLVSLLYGQLTHAIGLNDVCDALRLHSGMLVSLRAVPLETRSSSNRSPKRGRIFWRAIYGICAAISVGSYFISYQHPPLSPAIVSPTADRCVPALHSALDRISL